MKQFLILVLAWLGIGLYFSLPLIKFISGFVSSEVTFISSVPQGMFGLFLTTAVTISLSGIIFCLLIWFLFWGWDALYPEEQRIVKSNFGLALILFLVGIFFGGAVYLFFGLPFFVEFNSAMGVKSLWDLGFVVKSVLSLSFFSGIIFLIPLVLKRLIQSNVLDGELLRKNRLIIWFVLWGLVAVITPPDLVSELIIFLPLVGLIEWSIR